MVADQNRLTYREIGIDTAGGVGEDHGVRARSDRRADGMDHTGEVVTFVGVGAARENENRRCRLPAPSARCRDARRRWAARSRAVRSSARWRRACRTSRRPRATPSPRTTATPCAGTDERSAMTAAAAIASAAGSRMTSGSPMTRTLTPRPWLLASNHGRYPGSHALPRTRRRRLRPAPRRPRGGSDRESLPSRIGSRRSHALLDEVEAHDGPAALVTTATGKFCSNGLDTDWVFANLTELPAYLDTVHDLYVRMLTFPAATVAAVQGHAFGAGAMLALAHDFRVMRADRGFWCLPEVQLNMPFTVGMSALRPVPAADPDRGRGHDDRSPLRRHRCPRVPASSSRRVDGDAVLAAAVDRARRAHRHPRARTSRRSSVVCMPR